MTVLLPILAQAGAGQVGAALAIWLKCRKNKPLVGIVKGGLPSGILGIGEPLIYGVTLLWANLSSLPAWVPVSAVRSLPPLVT